VLHTWSPAVAQKQAVRTRLHSEYRSRAAISCSAYRLRRREPSASSEADLRHQLQRQRRLTAHTVYECPSCGDRYVGERRCESCGLFCRSLGLGVHCSECDAPILLSDMLE
jgi:hypothetical protein